MDHTLEMLRVQQDAAASRNADLAGKEQHEADREKREREAYIHQLFEQTSAVNDGRLGFFAEVDAPYTQVQEDAISVLEALDKATGGLLALMEEHDGVTRKLSLDESPSDKPGAGQFGPRCDLLKTFVNHHCDHLEGIGALCEDLMQIVRSPPPRASAWNAQ